MLLEHTHCIVVDLEATCSQDGTVPRDAMEIIELGAVALDVATMEPLGEFQSFVRPVRHPRLTPFCTELTTITQEEVDRAPGFVAMRDAFAAWLEGFEDAVMASWGAYDKQQLARDCAYHGVAYPFSEAHVNVKAEFSAALGTRKRFGMAAALRKLQLPLDGTHHRGIDDARNIARIARWLVLGGASAPGARGGRRGKKWAR